MRKLRTLWSRMRARDRRALVAGLLVVGAGLFVTQIAPATARRITALQQETELAQGTLRSARAVIAGAPAMRESLAVRARRLTGWAPSLFGDSSLANAQAELAAWVNGAATTHNVRVLRQDVGRDSTVSLFVRLSQRVEAEGDAQGVMGWLAALESEGRVVQVQGLRIDALDPAGMGAERLHVELVLHALAVVRPRQVS